VEACPSTLEQIKDGEVNGMTISPLAGKPAPKQMLIDVARLEKEYFERRPDLGDPNQLVSFGTNGHRGSPLHGTSPKRTSWPSRKPSVTNPSRAGN